MPKKIRESTSKFVRVVCSKCENEQVIFGKATTKVKCINCNSVLTKSGGSKAKIKVKVLEVLK